MTIVTTKDDARARPNAQMEINEVVPSYYCRFKQILNVATSHKERRGISAMRCISLTGRWMRRVAG